jgi:hypothetical protein
MRTATTTLPGATGFQMGRMVSNAGGCAIGFPAMRRRKAVGTGVLGMRMTRLTTAVASETGRGTAGATAAGALARSQGPHPTTVDTAAGAETRAPGGGMTAGEGRTTETSAGEAL